MRNTLDNPPPAATLLFEALKEVEQTLGLPLYLTLLAIAQEPGLSINELAERIDVPQQTASRYVASLQGRYDSPGREIGPVPLVRMDISQADPRSRSLHLTPVGSKRLDRLLKLLKSSR
ncbi:helix-turn-helix domain-containing protein [Methylocapsa sp. D3K7]|uniref:helix-turn-helix domain-containing protein n=1 Tax=Methylocapsa sp. D3K7 TaxID=3041435 RepID=UPI00244E865B|nr:helix-turn-helix domain-containing protein [Methylocapsa sp. D3K7]WGJ13640.1 helix-turn-helix domain-containing protein [Methylocapsa sp. D3K7]